MGVKYKDYYQVLGVPHNASESAVRKAYRRLARETHPDVNKTPDAKARFQEISEAYEVLGDPEKRKRYDRFGANWRHGQEFTPPPGKDHVHFDFSNDSRSQGGRFSGAGGFSDFFETLFGDMLSGQERGFRPSAHFGEPAHRRTHDEAELTVSLEEAFHGATKRIQIFADDGLSPKNGELHIPPGIRDGARLRLRGRGRYGDLLIRIRIASHARFAVNGADLEVALPLSPPEAVLGATAGLQLIDGHASLRIPPGTPSGRKFRLAGKGLKKPGGGRGDVYAIVQIDVPKQVSEEERRLYEQLAECAKRKKTR
jgi:curved DNA-binding protein